MEEGSVEAMAEETEEGSVAETEAGSEAAMAEEMEAGSVAE